jgi:uncharacterized SAM-binding protein YcdF (DUF218 family)
MEPISGEVAKDARVLWDFHVLPNDPVKSDVVICLGSSDLRVAQAAGTLMLESVAPLMVISGGFGKVTHSDAECEAVRFARVVEQMGMDMSRVILEREATNTGENFVLSRRLLEQRRVVVRTGTFVSKPYMMRRALATAQAQWPGVKWHAHAPAIPFEEYANDEIPQRQVIELMVGDLQRIDVYGRKGFQVPIEIPAEVWAAYERLVTAGFGRYLIR